MSTRMLMASVDIEVVTHGPLPFEVVEYARERVMAVARESVQLVQHARIKLSYRTEPAVPQPFQAKAGLDLEGNLLRAQVAATSVFTAVDLLADRLRHRLAALAHGWSGNGAPAPRPDRYPRLVDRREVVRQKSYELRTCTTRTAVHDMERLDFDVHLFVEESTGQEAVVYRTGTAGYGVVRLPASRLTMRAALDRINATDQPFLFFADATTGRGRLLYRRYDGHYGLVRPADRDA
jgi:ribosome-associated translation inhibitor RaiA